MVGVVVFAEFDGVVLEADAGSVDSNGGAVESEGGVVTAAVGIDELVLAEGELLQPISDVLKPIIRIIKTGQCFRTVTFVLKMQITPFLNFNICYHILVISASSSALSLI